MMKKINNILLLLLLAAAQPAKADIAVIEYLKEMQKALSNNMVDYKMTCIYPSNRSVEVEGRMAVYNSMYYDSSNMRFALYNERWQIMANHADKFLSVTYIPALKQKMKGLGALTVTSYLFSGDFILEKARVAKMRELNDTLWFRLHFDDQDMVEYLDIKMLKGFKLLSYDIKVSYPLIALGIPAADDEMLNITFHAHSIQTPAPSALFDTRRFINERGKKATLKKFTDYKTTFPSI